MADTANAFLQAFVAGKQIRAQQDAVARQAQLDADAAEDRKLEREGLKIRLSAMKLEEKLRPRLAAMERIKYLETLQPDQMPFEASEDRPDGMGGLSPLLAADLPGTDLPAHVRAQAKAAAANLRQYKPQTVPGVEELGLPTEAIRPRTVQDVLAQQLRAQRQEILMKPVTAKPGETTVIPLTGEVIAQGGEAPPASDLERQLKILSDEFEATNGRTPNAKEKATLLRETKQLSRDPDLDALNVSIKQLQLDALKKAKDAGEITPKQFSQAMQMTNSLKSHPEYTDMLDISTGWQGVQVGLRQKNGFGDIMAINAIQRMVDPGATVREGDVALLQSASSLLDTVLSEYPIEKLKSGAKLPDAVRLRMRTAAEQLYAALSKNYNDSVGTQYQQLAEAAGIPFNLVGSTFNAPLKIGSGPSIGTTLTREGKTYKITKVYPDGTFDADEVKK